MLHEWPASAWRGWNPERRDRVDTGAAADERFAAWCKGRTGFPIVDAGMRQLVAEGWMHNRVRMITASFLVKDLHLDWTRGARFFLEHLVDGDLAVEQPRLAVGRRHRHRRGAVLPGVQPDDARARSSTPTGTYVRRWVPELAASPVAASTTRGRCPTARRPATRPRSSTTPPNARKPSHRYDEAPADDRR